MPELPEVETTRQGISAYVCESPIANVTVREPRLRWPVPPTLPQILKGHTFKEVSRRGKYLLLSTDNGTLIIHLGMSGSLRILSEYIEPGKHDHVDIVFANNKVLRLKDPRRFGAVLWCETTPNQHQLLENLGIEPLSAEFNGGFLYQQGHKRKVAVKQFIMNSHIVVGVGNIYANEALFLAGIKPTQSVNKISRQRMDKLADAIKLVLKKAIKKGGTSLRDFTRSDGNPGYFKQSLNVYGRESEACINCGSAIRLVRQGQRATYYCPRCQK